MCRADADANTKSSRHLNQETVQATSKSFLLGNYLFVTENLHHSLAIIDCVTDMYVGSDSLCP